MLKENGLFLKLWNIVLILVYIYTGHVSPIKVCFNETEEEGFSYGFEKFIDFLIFVDIIIHFFTPKRIQNFTYLYD